VVPARGAGERPPKPGPESARTRAVLAARHFERIVRRFGANRTGVDSEDHAIFGTSWATSVKYVSPLALYARAIARRFAVIGSAILVLAIVTTLDSSPSASAAGVVAVGPRTELPEGSVPLPPGARPTSTDLPSATTLTGLVTLEPADPAGLEEFVRDVSTPGSPMYRHYLRAGQFGSRFGASTATVDATTSWLHAQGITAISVAPDHLSIGFAASASLASAAFGMHLLRYRLPTGRIAFAPDRAPSVPRALAGSIIDVTGLSDVAQVRPHLALPRGVPGERAADPAPTGRTERPGVVSPHVSPTSGVEPCSAAKAAASASGGYTPDEVASAYGLDTLYGQGRLGAGETAAVVELETYNASDIAAYQSCMGTDVPVNNVVVATPDDSDNPYPGLETALDVETVIGLAPQSSVLVYQGDGDTSAGVLAVYSRIADDDRAQVVTTSWGECEAALGSSMQQAEKTIFEQMAAQGQSVFAAAGDSGSEDCFDAATQVPDTGLAVDDPGSQPDVTSVGGTTMTVDGNPPTESVWNSCENQSYASCADAARGDGAGGGGQSSAFESPSWQGFSGAREVPDVSANADPNDGTVIDYDGQWETVGGTSAAAPLWAALLGDVDQGCQDPVGEVDPAIYPLARDPGSTAFHDVTVGNNDYTDTNHGQHPASTGYDMASGWGTPDAASLVTGLQAPGGCPTVTGLSPSSSPGTGTSVTITGSGLGGATSVYFGGLEASIISDGTDSITVTAPVSCPTGTVNVTVVTDNGTSAIVPIDEFDYTSPGCSSTPEPYTSMTPTRICDTRMVQPGVAANQCNGDGASPGTLGPGQESTITVPELPSGATAAVLNVTVTGPSTSSYLTVWPAGTPRPLASNLNWQAGQNVANLVEVDLGSGSRVSFYNAAGSTDLVVDLEGYVAPASVGTGLYNPLVPTRICDTRAVQFGVDANQCNGAGAGAGTLGPGAELTVQVTGQGGVPSSGVSAVVMNVTVAGPTEGSYLTVWPAGEPRPTTSNLNWSPGTTIANRVIVPVGTDGQVNFYNAAGFADVVVDVGGWFTDNSNSSATGADYVALFPTRICDTRAEGAGVAANECNGNGTAAGTLGPGESIAIQVAGLAGVPSGAIALVANVTVADTTGNSYLTLWPDGVSQPKASDLNWAAGQNVPNLVVVKLGADGDLDIFNAQGNADLIVDVEGYYTG